MNDVWMYDSMHIETLSRIQCMYNQNVDELWPREKFSNIFNLLTLINCFIDGSYSWSSSTSHKNYVTFVTSAFYFNNLEVDALICKQRM
jgi:hypothetical protein